jgi:hypothetical protein
MIENLLEFLIITVFWVVTFLLTWFMHIQNNNDFYTSDLTELYMTSYHVPTLLSSLLILFCGVQKNLFKTDDLFPFPLQKI